MYSYALILNDFLFGTLSILLVMRGIQKKKTKIVQFLIEEMFGLEFVNNLVVYT